MAGAIKDDRGDNFKYPTDFDKLVPAVSSACMECLLFTMGEHYVYQLAIEVLVCKCAKINHK